MRSLTWQSLLSVAGALTALGRPARRSGARGNAAVALVLAALALAVAALPAQAQTRWTGTQSEDWFDAGNWTSGVPASNVDASLSTVMPHLTVIDGRDAVAGTVRLGDGGGTGELIIRDGGTLVSPPGGVIGDDPGSRGTVTVTGVGSSWTANSLTIGRQGNGTLTIAEGGRVSCNCNISEASASGSVGTLNIGAAPGDEAVAPGILDARGVQLGAGSGRIGTVNFNHTADDYVFAPRIFGGNAAGAVNALSGVTIFTNTENDYQSPTTIFSGATLQAGVDNTFSPNSAHTVEADGILNLDGFDQTILSLTNGGLVMLGGSVPDTKLTVGNYVGHDGTLAINTFLGDDSSPSDQLVINGGTATGTTGIRVINAGGPGAQTTGDGIKVVDAINGGTTASGAFVLDGRAVAGAYEYLLFRGSQTDASDNNWYLRSEGPGTCPGPEPEPGPSPGPGPGPSPPPEPAPELELFRPEIGAYLGNTRAAATMFVQTLHERLGEPQYTEDMRAPYESLVGSVWLRAVGRYTNVDPHCSFRFGTEATTWLLQAGGDAAQWSLLGEDDRLHLGGMLGYGETTTKAHSVGDPFRADAEAKGYSVGVYATWYENDADRRGLYFDAWGLFGLFDNTVAGQELSTVDYTSRALAASLEAGYAFRLFTDWLSLEPQAQIVYTRLDQDSVTEPNGTRVTNADENLVTSRLGGRVYGSWAGAEGRKIEPYIELNWWHDFQDDSVAFNGLTFEQGVPDDRFEAGVGFSAEVAENWSIWANGEYQFGAHGYEGVEGLGGVKYTW